MFTNFQMVKGSNKISFKQQGDVVQCRETDKQHTATIKIKSQEFSKFISDTLKMGYKAHFQ